MYVVDSGRAGHSESELASIALEDASLLIVSTDATGLIRVFGGECERLTGIPEQDARGRPVWEVIAQRDERAALREAFAGGLRAFPARFVAHSYGADGSVRVVIWSQRAVYTESGTVDRVVFTGVDVTDRERVEELVRDTGARQELILDQLPAVHWTTDRKLTFTSGGGAALAGLGFQPAQLDGVSLFTLFGTDRTDHPNIAPSLRALEGETVVYDADWLGRVFYVVTKPLRDYAGDIVGTINVGLDVTERVEAERERDRLLVAERRALGEAKAALAQRDEFLSIASHELSTPVTSLQLALDSLSSKEARGAAADQLLELAAKQTTRLSRLIGELLDVSRIRAGRLVIEPEPTDLAAAAGEVAARLGPAARAAGCELQLRAPAPVLGTWDRSRLEQVISNLVENAIRHAPGAPITVRAEPRDDGAALEVADRGPGIDPKRLPYIFDRFERATSARHHGGLGLGLYIVWKLVVAHGGEVSVATSLGRGTTFRIRLPRRAPAADLPTSGSRQERT